MTNDYTHVQLKRQEELTRAIQDRLGEAAKKVRKEADNVKDVILPTDRDSNTQCWNRIGFVIGVRV